MPGRGLDVSESGMAAILPVELEIGENVDLEFKKSGVTHHARASVRHKNVFRHGFEFIPLSTKQSPTFAKSALALVPCIPH